MQTTIPGAIACGMDVHKDKIDVCVRIGDGSADGNVIIKTFSTMRKSLFELRDWLISLNCFKVLMESTGVFWMPIYWVLEEVLGMNVGVGNARDLKNAPGRPKTDREDAKWLSRLCMFGLVLKSFIVGRPFRALREYTRYHKKLVQERARQINRIEKLLQMNGFKLSTVLSNITGASGRKILAKIADEGELSVSDIKAELDRRCKSTPEEIESAINGVMKLTSRLLLRLQLKKLEGCDSEIDEVYDFMLHLSEEHAWAIHIIASIPGMSILSAIYIIAEIGTDLSSFKTANHLAAWAGLAPKDNRSADKARPSRTKKANQYVKSVFAQ
jgi:transposase